MAFLDNSGDIILDAVLTDTGRMRLAKGDGTFKIVKFALGDDEIDYGLFDKNHASGSAYYDLAIMQTPVLEAFTNNTSLLKHKLISMPQTNLLYLPVVKLDDQADGNAAVKVPSSTISAHATQMTSTVGDPGTGLYLLPADDETLAYLKGYSITGVLDSSKAFLKAMQGLDTGDISYTRAISSDLRETQYIVQVDNRLAQVVKSDNNDRTATVSYIDDDQIASYYFSTQDSEYVRTLEVPSTQPDIIRGPQGSEVMFNLYRSEEIETSTSLFAELGGGAGSVMTIDNISSGDDEFYYIDTNVRISGATTGSSIDIPVRVMKYYRTV
tara:strand:- start:1013 stop:1990 length:978 start_codon:yes stop_codon:yes gene_type:complete